MDIYLAGAEQPVYLRHLADLEATHVAISFYEWQRRHSTDDLYKHIPAGMKVCITPGIARKQEMDFKAFAEDYIQFAERNAEEALVYDFDTSFCPPKIHRAVRNHLSVLPNVVIFPTEDEVLTTLAKEHERLGVNARMAKSLPTNELRRVQATLYGSNVSDAKVLRGARFAATTSMAWLSGHRFGELWVFSRGRMHHYKAESLAKAVRIHRDVIAELGVDPDACAANDKTALTAIAVISLREMAKSLSKRPRDRQDPEIADTSANGTRTGVVVAGTTHGDGSVSNKGTLEVIDRERITLPVISVNGQLNGHAVTSNHESMRKCDSCNLSDVCPQFDEGHSCAYDIPVTIGTDKQMDDSVQVIIEAQFKRVMHGYFAEQIDGGSITARVGQEMDRYLKLLGSLKDLKTPTVSPGIDRLATIFQPSPDVPRGDDLTPQLGSPDDDEEIESGSYEESFGQIEDAEIVDVEDEDDWDDEFQPQDGTGRPIQSAGVRYAE